MFRYIEQRARVLRHDQYAPAYSLAGLHRSKSKNYSRKSTETLARLLFKSPLPVVISDMDGVPETWVLGFGSTVEKRVFRQVEKGLFFFPCICHFVIFEDF